MDTILGNAFL